MAWTLTTFGVLFLHLAARARLYPHELVDPNAMDYAQIARHVSRGEGFTTSYIRPLSLQIVPRYERHPDLSYPPLYIGFMALLFKLVGASASTAVLASGLPFIAGAPLVYVFARRTFGQHAALLAIVLYGTNINLLSLSVSGTEATLLALEMLALFYLSLRFVQEPRSSHKLAVAIGVVGGLIFLTKYILLVAVLPCLVLIWRTAPPKRLAHVGLACAALILIISPWLVRNWCVAGSPFFTLRKYELAMNTDTYAGQSVYREFRSRPPSPLQFLIYHPREVVKKVQRGSMSAYQQAATVAGSFISVFYIAGVIVRWRDRSAEQMKWALYASLVLTLLVLLAVPPVVRLLQPFGPLLIVVSAGVFLTMLEARLDKRSESRHIRLRRLAIAGLVLLCWYPLVARFTTGPAEYDVPASRVAAEYAEAGEPSLIATNVPWWMAWWGDVDAVWLPQRPDEFRAIQETVGPIPEILISPAIKMQIRSRGGDPLDYWFLPWYLAVRGRSSVAIPGLDHSPHQLLGRDQDWVVFKPGPGPPLPRPSRAPGPPGMDGLELDGILPSQP